MKREIVCPKCRKNLRELFPTNNPYPGEYVKFVDGTARHDFVCDSCGKPINYNGKCTAFSCWAEYGGIPYMEWEDEYLREAIKNKEA